MVCLKVFCLSVFMYTDQHICYIFKDLTMWLTDSQKEHLPEIRKTIPTEMTVIVTAKVAMIMVVMTSMTEIMSCLHCEFRSNVSEKQLEWKVKLRFFIFGKNVALGKWWFKASKRFYFITINKKEKNNMTLLHSFFTSNKSKIFGKENCNESMRNNLVHIHFPP